MLNFVDSHCHLDRIDLTQFDNRFDNLISAAQKANVSHMLCVSIGLPHWQKMADLVAPFNNISLSVGIHPSEAHNEALPSLESFKPMLEQSNVIAIGETGLDYHYNQEHKLTQQESFIRQIDIARSSKKPIIVHTRDAQHDTIDILKKEKASDAGGILHCYTENWEMAKKGLDLGFYISFSGIVTFKNAEMLREVMRKTPLDRILIETDAPYLAPVPYRGKTNHPALVPFIAETLANIKEITIEEAAKITTQNFETLFNLKI